MRKLGAIAIGGILTAAFASAALADFPSRTVTYVIPFNPGGASDETARMKESFFTELTGQQLVISYRPGAGGAVGWANLNDYAGDGYTIMGVNLPHIITQPLLGGVGYETEDIVNVHIFHYTPHALVVRSGSEFETLEDLIEVASNNPGALTFAGSGSHSANHLAQQAFDQLAGVTTTYVPMSGAAPAQAALLGGHITGAWLDTASVARLGDQVRMLAGAMEERISLFPDVPTFTELGIDLVGGTHRGVAVPQSMPPELRAAWSELIAAIATNPEFIEKMEAGGYVVTNIRYEDMDAFMSDRIQDYTNLLEQMGVLN